MTLLSIRRGPYLKKKKNLIVPIGESEEEPNDKMNSALLSESYVYLDLVSRL